MYKRHFVFSIFMDLRFSLIVAFEVQVMHIALYVKLTPALSVVTYKFSQLAIKTKRYFCESPNFQIITKHLSV